MKKAVMRFCFNCGAEIGIYADYQPSDTCGNIKCEREAQAQFAEEREDAHERLDRDMGLS